MSRILTRSVLIAACTQFILASDSLDLSQPLVKSDDPEEKFCFEGENIDVIT